MFNQRRQRGITMFGFLLFAAVAIFAALLAMKLVPAYVEFMTIKKILNDIGSSTDIANMDNAQIRNTFSNRAMVDNITSVTSSDLNIEQKNGVPVASVNYTYQTVLVGNISILIDFKASSASGGSGSHSVTE